jgi:hypothetical protein
MIAYIKALLPSFFLTIIIIGFIAFLHFIIYDTEWLKNGVEDFFGITVGRFDYIKYLIISMITWLGFGYVMMSDYKEQTK